VKLIGRICPLVLCSMLCSILSAQQPPAPAPAAQPPAPAAPPPVQPREPENIDRMFSIGLYDWLPSGGPAFRTGTKALVPPPHNLTLPQKPSRAYGAMITIPTKGSTRLEFSYLTINDRGNTIAPSDLGLFGGTIAQGEPLAMDYSLRQIKMSWNYLTYPNPPQDAKFRIKTLWEFHYLQIKPTVVATLTAPDQPLTGSQRIILPAVGLGMEFVPSKRFRMEFRGSGMALPHRAMLGDAEGSAVVRLWSLEIFLGGKLLYFRTSPNQDTYIKGTLWGPYGGARWVFR
jgi:hypothetical protein